MDAGSEWATSVDLVLAFDSENRLVVCSVGASRSPSPEDAKWLGSLTPPERLLSQHQMSASASAAPLVRSIPEVLEVYSNATGPLANAWVVLRPRAMSAAGGQNAPEPYWVIHGCLPGLRRSTVRALRDARPNPAEQQRGIVEVMPGLFLDGTRIPPIKTGR